MATIIINDLSPRVQYTVSTVPQNNFTVPFPFFDASDLTVIKTVNETPATLTLDNDYTVVGAGQSAGGRIDMALPVTNCRITIKREMPLKRTSDFPTVGPFPIQALNDDLDKLVIMIQQVQAAAGRAIRMSDDDPFPGLELPPPSQRANKALVFGPAGDAKVSEQTFDSVVQQAQQALAEAQQLKGQIDQKLDQAIALLNQAQQAGLLPVATAGDAGRALVVGGAGGYALGAIAAFADLTNVGNAAFAAKATAAGVGGGGGGTGNPFFTAALYGGSF